jgi:hypothetical protein
VIDRKSVIQQNEPEISMLPSDPRTVVVSISGKLILNLVRLQMWRKLFNDVGEIVVGFLDGVYQWPASIQHLSEALYRDADSDHDDVILYRITAPAVVLT